MTLKKPSAPPENPTPALQLSVSEACFPDEKQPLKTAMCVSTAFAAGGSCGILWAGRHR